ncbi:MAG: DeoR family suf operon transcriptional repressor [Ilumatobacter sp.]|jgi:DeoR family suf operon transcriptional repressor
MIKEMTALVSPAQRRVLEVLKRHGEATADQLAEALAISPGAARQHLSSLRSAGYVDARQERGQPGRPADRFHTTDRTEAMFAARPETLSIELLVDVEEEDPELVARVFERQRLRRVEAVRHHLDGKNLADKVAALAVLLDAEGYLADTDGSNPECFHINLHSCPIWNIATQFGQACTSELEFIRDLIPEARVERVAHKAIGAHTCMYEIHP